MLVWLWLKDWFFSQLDRIPRPAWQISLDCSPGYIAFDRGIMDEEVQLSRDEGYEDGFTIKRIWISPAKLESLGEFIGW
jgi:hypothetical protein